MQQPSSSTAAALAASPAQTDRYCQSILLAPAVSTASSGKRHRSGRFVTEPTRGHAAAADRLFFALKEKGAGEAADRLQRDVLALRPFVGTFLVGDVVSRSHVVLGKRAVLDMPLVALVPHSNSREDGEPQPLPPFKLMEGLSLRAEVATPSGRTRRQHE